MPNRRDLYSRWALEVAAKRFFHPGQRVGVAVSGGPDSVLLLHFMKILAKDSGLTLAAVHFNHRLRGAESDGDEAFVRSLAATLGVEYLGGAADVGQAARDRHGNLEAVARDLRYRYFFSLIDQDRLDIVATAHTASDQAETVLMRILRGTGTRGLGGIYPLLDGKVVRPFLSVTRAEVMREIGTRGISYRIDSTNLNLRLRRNKVRNELLPLLEREYNPAIVMLLNQLAERSRDDEVCLERLARERAHPWRVRAGVEERIPVRVLCELSAALARRVLRQMIQAVRGSTRGLTHVHIESLRRFAAGAQSGKTLVLPGGVRVRKEFSWLVAAPSDRPAAREDFSYAVTIPGELPVPELSCSFHFKILSRDCPSEGYNQTKPVGVDPHKLSADLALRNWRAGDGFSPVGSRTFRKLKELFRERKIPEDQRRSWPVLLSAGQIVWVRGMPPAKEFAVTEASRQVLVIEEEVAGP